jgi:membrane fusion protein, copper/silver efflux system
MKKRLAAIVVIAAVAAAFAAGTWIGSRSASTPAGAPSAQKVRYYTCPMHPAYRADRPGDCPSCGMRLEPVYEDDRRATAGAPPDASGVVQVSAERQQIIGIRIGRVEERTSAGMVRTVGRTSVDENRVFRLVAAGDGLVKRIFNNSTGSLVRKNELLLHFYTREFIGAEQAYFFALQSYDRFVQENASADQVNVALTQIRSTIDTLQNMGMGDVQIAALAKSRAVTTDIEMRSPVDGCILARNVTPLQRFDRGAELYRIADLSRVWILADVAARENFPLPPGTPARISAPYGTTRTIEARVADVLPQFDATSRTLKLRLEAENPDYVLRPDMFVEVELPVSLPQAVTVPVDAVVDSGLKKTVFVDRGNGYFEPRRVQTGWRFEDRVEILKGLMPGERIVLSGNFLLDSESRMQAGSISAAVPRHDPVCGMVVDEARAKTAGRTVAYAGQTYYFCSDQCRKNFEASPARYATGGSLNGPSAAPPTLPFHDTSLENLPGLESVPGGILPSQAPVVTKLRPLAPPRASSGPGILPVPSSVDQSRQADEPQPTPAPSTRRIRVSRDPACGISVSEADAATRGLTSQAQGRTLFFSSAECKKAFDDNPAQYLVDLEPASERANAAVPRIVPPEPAVAGVTDPVCGVSVDGKHADAAGLRSTYKGSTYYFCSDACKKTFDKDPARYSHK